MFWHRICYFQLGNSLCFLKQNFFPRLHCPSVFVDCMQLGKSPQIVSLCIAFIPKTLSGFYSVDRDVNFVCKSRAESFEIQINEMQTCYVQPLMCSQTETAFTLRKHFLASSLTNSFAVKNFVESKLQMLLAITLCCV